jgi:L-rhamnose mutarotase
MLPARLLLIKKISLFPALLVVFCLVACNISKGKTNTSYVTVVMTTDLVNDSAAIQQYEYLHSKQGVWPELKKANEVSGINEIQIYRFDNRLVMMVTYPEHTDVQKMDSLYISSHKRVKEWGELMSKFQQSLPGVDSAQKWVVMKRIHHYKDGQYY